MHNTKRTKRARHIVQPARHNTRMDITPRVIRDRDPQPNMTTYETNTKKKLYHQRPAQSNITYDDLRHFYRSQT